MFNIFSVSNMSVLYWTSRVKGSHPAEKIRRNVKKKEEMLCMNVM
jgi:hypothetical protein